LLHHRIVIDSARSVAIADRWAYVVQAGSLDGVAESGTNGWYGSGVRGWETATFVIFRALIEGDMVYLGFGEWIGPTILYGAQLAKQSYGLEPDLVAYRSLALNARANHCFGDRLKLFSACISYKSGAFHMEGATGSSMATLTERVSTVAERSAQPTYCHTLRGFLSNHSLLDERMFIKVDTEGAEATLFSSFTEVVKHMRHKPVWYISKHANPLYTDPAVKASVLELASHYQCARYAPAAHQHSMSAHDIMRFKVSELPAIHVDVLSAEANPDFLLVDLPCSVVDAMVDAVVPLFV